MGRRTNTAVWLAKYNRWQIKVQKEGERRTFSSPIPGRNGQRACNKKADDWLDQNIFNADKKTEFFIKDYIEDLKVRTSRSHWHGEENRCKNWISPEIGNLKLSRVTDQHLQNIINKAFKAGLAKKSLQNLRATIMALYKFCRKCNATERTPENITIPKEAPQGEHDIAQPEDLIKLFQIDTTVHRGKRIRDDYINAYRFQVITGLRPGELLGIKPDNIIDNVLYLRQARNIYGEITHGKNENAIRNIELGSLAMKIVEDQLKHFEGQEFLFCNITESGYLKRWKRYCECNSLTSTTVYELRHTYVSVVQDLPEAWIKALVGHSKSMDTFGVYRHDLKGKNSQIASAVDSIFENLLFQKK